MLHLAMNLPVLVEAVNQAASCEDGAWEVGDYWTQVGSYCGKLGRCLKH